MAENVQITPGTGVTIGADSVTDGTLGSAQIQYIKIMDGTIGGTNKAAVTVNGLTVDGSGVTQPISAVSLPLPTNAATETTLALIKIDTDNLDVALSTRASELTLNGIKTQTDKLTFVSSRLLIDGSGVTQPVSGTITANAGTGNFTVIQSIGANLHANIDNFPASQTVNGTIAATQSGTWTVTLSTGSIEIGTVDQGTPNTLTNAWPTKVTDGTNVLSLTVAGEAKVIVTEPLPVGSNAIGSVTVSNFPTSPVSTSNITNVVASTSSVVLLASNAARKLATVYNDSTSQMFLAFGSAASLSNFTVRLQANDYYEFPIPVFLGSVNAIWTTATGNARITEFS